MANRCVLILGGARSGKSRYAQELADQSGNNVVFVATAEALDEEMKARIKKHKKSRPAHWQTLEAPSGIHLKLNNTLSGGEVVVIDCITLLISNIIGKCRDNAAAEKLATKEINSLIKCMKMNNATFIIVSNEVGLGIVPDNDLARLYRDVLGRANQLLAYFATDVYFMTAGLPVQIKNTPCL